MRVVLGAMFDAGAWPGALGAAEGGVLDEAWLGALGFLKLLETHLGLGGVHAEITRPERAASLVPALSSTPGPWSRSLDADPLAVARSVLRLRDALVDAGVPPRGGSGVTSLLPPRLRGIMEVARNVLPGPGDRLAVIIEELAVRAPDLDDVALCEPVSTWSPLWQRVFAALRAQGVPLREVRVDGAVDVAGGDHGSDLARSRAPGFAPRDDGTLQLLRSDCPEEAAAEVAAHIASLDGAPVLVVGGDALLDVGLARLGLPTLGARGERGDDGYLQLAPLVVALAWPERDPERAFELLTLSVSPLRRSLAGPLSRALAREPAVYSDAWCAALAKATADFSDIDRKRAVDRVAALFGAPPPGAGRTTPATTSSTTDEQTATPDQIADTMAALWKTVERAPAASVDRMPLRVLENRLVFVNRWLQRRAVDDADDEKIRGAIAQVAAIRRTARAFGSEALTRTEIMRVVEQATASVRAMRARPSQAGIAQVRDPGAVAGPCAHVVWWSFSASQEPPLRAPWLTNAERAGLEALGIHVVDAGAAAEARAALYARPHAFASSSLVLCCPRRDRKGDAGHPHPLWDEIVARAPAGATAVLERSALAPRAGGLARRAFKVRALAQPQRTFTFAAGSVTRPEIEWATRVETLLGCPFRAVLERCRLATRARRLRDGSQLFGDLAHDVLARVLLARPASAAAAAELARAVFDERTPLRAAVLLRPVEASQLLRSRDLIARAAERLIEILEERKLAVKLVEHEVRRAGEGREMRGRLDLVVEGAGGHLVVIDHKTGSERRRLRELEQGAAIQLAVYAALLRALPVEGAASAPAREAAADWPGIGYFQIRSRRALTTDPALGGEQALDPGLRDVSWTAGKVREKAAAIEREIAAGRAEAPGVFAPRRIGKQAFVVEDDLTVPPPCTHCHFGLLCGRRLPERAPTPATTTPPATMPPTTTPSSSKDGAS